MYESRIKQINVKEIIITAIIFFQNQPKLEKNS